MATRSDELAPVGGLLSIPSAPVRRRAPTSMLRLPSTRVALFILFAIAFLVAFGSLLAPYNPEAQDVSNLLKGSTSAHLLGTDYLGREVLSRLMAGTRLSVLSALEAVAIALVLGTVPGVAVVFLGKWANLIAERISDGLMTLPAIVFAVSVTAAIGNGLVQAMVPIGIIIAPMFFRVTRAVTLEFARAQYVEAAELLGATRWHVIRVHVSRKVLPTIAVTTASAAAYALLTVSFLTFLGIGVEPPTPTWGGILSSDLNYLSQDPWAPFIPGALIAITVGALNALADAIRDRRPAYELHVPAEESSFSLDDTSAQLGLSERSHNVDRQPVA
jgi:peptide/nickel transport system permease protein